MLKRLILTVSLMLAAPALAVEPSEVLDDPAKEARAREVSKELRCLVCRNENIDESNASLAKELRVLVRDRITAGDSNEEVIDYVVDRYGEYVLLKPTVTGSNLVLYIAGPAMLLIGFIVALAYIRGRSRTETATTEALSPEEQARLKEIIGK